jgi:hypothetical protein
MREVFLNGKNVQGTALHVSFAEKLEKFFKRNGTVYQTYASACNRNVTLRTTSKDIHLFLGALSQSAQGDFVYILSAESSGEPFLLVGMYGNEQRKSILVTISTQRDSVVIDLSPAH